MKKLLLSIIPFLTACAGEPPQNIGVENGRLTACPESPNCVSSYESDEEHGIDALNTSLAQIEEVLLRLDEANIVNAASNYLYAEFTSRIMGYVDDVEFLFDQSAGVTHVRSASRLGHSDLGANRNRIESIRNATR
jgi:uncharacterized protein (DUF1499 family)|tara:strand:+ start:2100 stop:2507 length:408 start_codon:yes stop_codon:yes gene_type:complete